MSTDISFVNTGTHIKTAEFVQLVISTSTIYAVQPPTVNVSSSYKYETLVIDTPTVGTTATFTPVGGLLSVGEQHRDLQASSFDTSIVLDGVAYGNIFNVLQYELRGALVTIWRGFYDNNLSTPSIVKRFTGVVTSYVITEGQDLETPSYSVVLNVSSYKTILSNNIGGRRTNNDDWSRYDPTDTSMNNVANLSYLSFNFGVKV